MSWEEEDICCRSLEEDAARGVVVHAQLVADLYHPGPQIEGAAHDEVAGIVGFQRLAHELAGRFLAVRTRKENNEEVEGLLFDVQDAIEVALLLLRPRFAVHHTTC